jgi:hypothetical protein
MQGCKGIIFHFLVLILNFYFRYVTDVVRYGTHMPEIFASYMDRTVPLSYIM